MGPQYYQAGLQICSLPNEDAEQVSEVLPLVRLRLSTRIVIAPRSD